MSTLKYIKALGLALVAVFALGAVTAGSAFAESEWLINGSPVTEKTAVDSEAAELLLEDKKGGVFREAVALVCSGLDAGFVGPEKADEVTEVLNLEMSSPDILGCTVETGTCPDPLVEAVHLPWTTEVSLSGAAFRDLIVAGTGGAAGWRVVCLGPLGEEIADECTGASSTLLTNLAGGIVDAEFEAESEKANCTRGGTAEGEVRGLTEILLTTAGEELSVS